MFHVLFFLQAWSDSYFVCFDMWSSQGKFLYFLLCIVFHSMVPHVCLHTFLLLCRLFVLFFSWQKKAVWRKCTGSGPYLALWLHLGCLLLSMHSKTAYCRFHIKILIHWPFQSWTRQNCSSQPCLLTYYWGRLFQVTVQVSMFDPKHCWKFF